jgi:hypothetical protein
VKGKKGFFPLRTQPGGHLIVRKNKNKNFPLWTQRGGHRGGHPIDEIKRKKPFISPKNMTKWTLNCQGKKKPFFP